MKLQVKTIFITYYCYIILLSSIKNIHPHIIFYHIFIPLNVLVSHKPMLNISFTRLVSATTGSRPIPNGVYRQG